MDLFSHLCEMKKYIWIAIAAIILSLIISLLISISTNKKYKEDIEFYDNNFKALTLEADSLKNNAIAYQFEIEQLEYLNDSIIDKLNNSRQELKIKDKTIQQMQYVLSQGTVKDSIVFKDTVFRDKFIKIDTTLGDKWYSLEVKSLTPKSLHFNMSYTSELEVYAYKQRVILGTPKKCFISRWFQKKHNVIRVTVKDNNPHAVIKDKKFIILN